MGTLDEVRDLAESVAHRRSLTLWDVEMAGQPGRSVVRVFVEGEQGVDLDTVAEVSEEISRGLDERDPFQGRYTLEVSSPGLERTLRSQEHFARCIGRKAVIKTREALIPEGHRIEGTIAGATEEVVKLDTKVGEIDVPYEQLRSARTIFEWK
jgi:ribosome maturation factor RimP